MPPAGAAPSGATFIDLEFDTGTNGGTQLGDIASSLVSLDELLRDLASLAAYPSSAEFRKLEIAAIELRSPLKIRLSLFAIEPSAVKAFQEICRDVILARDGDEAMSDERLRRLKGTLERCVPEGLPPQISEQELQRVHGHMMALQRAEIRLKRVELRKA